MSDETTIEQEGNPPILSFAEIDKACMESLMAISHLPPEQSIDPCITILLGTLKELLRTLDSLKLGEPKVILMGKH